MTKGLLNENGTTLSKNVSSSIFSLFVILQYVVKVNLSPYGAAGFVGTSQSQETTISVPVTGVYVPFHYFIVINFVVGLISQAGS